MESVEPAAGSTVSATTAMTENAMSTRAGGRAPRATATRAAITPKPPTAIAAHSATVTNVVVRWSACHHGGPLAARTDGTAALGPAAEITTMTAVEAAMAAAPSQPISRVSSGDPGGSTRACARSFSVTNPPACWSVSPRRISRAPWLDGTGSAARRRAA